MTSKRTWSIAVALVASLLLAACGDEGTVERSGPAGDDGVTTTTTTTDGADTTEPDEPVELTISGDPLPTMTDDGDDSAVGMALPEISGPSLDGDELQLGPDGPLLIAVVAHWCPHCQREVPRLVDWIDDGTIPSSLDVVAVSTAVEEKRGNYPPASWLEREDWPAPVLADPENEVLDALGVSAFPTLIAVDADGRVALRMSGELEESQIAELVDAAQG